MFVTTMMHIEKKKRIFNVFCYVGLVCCIYAAQKISRRSEERVLVKRSSFTVCTVKQIGETCYYPHEGVWRRFQSVARKKPLIDELIHGSSFVRSAKYISRIINSRDERLIALNGRTDTIAPKIVIQEGQVYH
jgi:hypothetical protein